MFLFSFGCGPLSFLLYQLSFIVSEYILLFKFRIFTTCGRGGGTLLLIILRYSNLITPCVDTGVSFSHQDLYAGCSPGGEFSHQDLYAGCSPGGEFSHQDLYAGCSPRGEFFLTRIYTPGVVPGVSFLIRNYTPGVVPGVSFFSPGFIRRV